MKHPLWSKRDFPMTPVSLGAPDWSLKNLQPAPVQRVSWLQAAAPMARPETWSFIRSVRFKSQPSASSFNQRMLGVVEAWNLSKVHRFEKGGLRPGDSGLEVKGATNASFTSRIELSAAKNKPRVEYYWCSLLLILVSLRILLPFQGTVFNSFDAHCSLKLHRNVHRGFFNITCAIQWTGHISISQDMTDVSQVSHWNRATSRHLHHAFLKKVIACRGIGMTAMTAWSCRHFGLLCFFPTYPHYLFQIFQL